MKYYIISVGKAYQQQMRVKSHISITQSFVDWIAMQFYLFSEEMISS